MPPVRGSAEAVGARVLMAPGPGGTLFVAIPAHGGSVLGLLDGTGRSRPGWPIAIEDSTACDVLLPVDDGSVRVVCDATDLPQPEIDAADVRAFAFDAGGRLMAGWPVRLRPVQAGRMVGDELTIVSTRWFTDTVETGRVSHEVWISTISPDGSIRSGPKVPMIETCCGEFWAIGPNGVGYGSIHEVGDSVEAPKSSELTAVSATGISAGFPIELDGLASRPAFDAAGRIHVTVDDGPDRTARTLVFDTGGQAAVGGSDHLGLRSTDACVGIEGSCEVPATPLVGADGTTFVVGAYAFSTEVAGVTPSGQVMAGFPYRSEVGHQGTGICAPGEICEGYNLAAPAIGPDNVLVLVHGAATPSGSGHIVAIGEDGRVRAGWPVELKRPGAAFWSVVAGADGTAYALAIEPEASGASSATVLAIAPDSTVVYATTVIEP